MGTRLYALVVLSALAASAPAKADKLDDIIASGVLRCAVTLDFPPMGSRDAPPPVLPHVARRFRSRPKTTLEGRVRDITGIVIRS